MKIAVCIKQVVTREWQLRVNDQKTWIRDQDASFELNEPDAYALEEALRLKEKHTGEVIVCCAGPARATQVIREALARGADRAIHVESDALVSADGATVADALAAAIMDEQVDGGGLRVKRELEGGWFQWVSLPLPALLTIQSGINQLRYATLKGIMAAKKKEIAKVPSPGGGPARQKITALYAPQKSKQTVMITGSPAEAAKELVKRL